MLRKIDENIWVAEQPFKYFGLEVGTRMTVIRLLNDELIIISPIQTDEQTINELNAIGKVAYIIAPNVYHHLFISKFKAIYPDAKLWIPPALESKIPTVSVNKVISDSEGNIFEQIDYLLFDGFKIFDLSGVSILNEFVFFHRQSHTLILTDTAFHFDKSFSLRTRLATKFLGVYEKLTPSPLEKLAINEKTKVKNSIQKVLTWDFNRVIMAHGSIIEDKGNQKLKQGYESFLGISL
jgi:Domain of unknown function (DUF4336)